MILVEDVEIGARHRQTRQFLKLELFVFGAQRSLLSHTAARLGLVPPDRDATNCLRLEFRAFVSCSSPVLVVGRKQRHGVAL